MSTAQQSEPVQRYFVPGEFFIVLEVPEQDNGEQKAAIVRATQSLLSQIIGDDGGVNFLDRLKREIEREFDQGEKLNDRQREAAKAVLDKTSQYVSEIQVSLEDAFRQLDEDSVVLIRDRAHVFLQVQDGPLLDDEILAYVAGEIELVAREKDVSHGSYRLIGASLNWLMSGSQGNLTSGGPGALPVPPFIRPGTVITEDDYKFIDESLKDTPSGPARTFKSNVESTTVKVYILDTVPKHEQLTEAVNKWGRENELIGKLLGSGFDQPEDLKFVGDPLTLQYYEKQALDKVFIEPFDYGIDDQDYLMPDHGLFIAGIIHAQAECATLHMIQVLNDYGVGSFRALLWGLEKVSLAMEEGETAIVNCSLTYVPDERAFAEDPRQIGPFLGALHLIIPEWIIEDIAHEYQSLVEVAVVVAAAGNDSRFDVPPVPAKFPAALAGVHGVGALLSDQVTRAPYSNEADTPLADGFFTFGGDVNHVEASVKTGILSIYTGKTYPSKHANKTGWARWAGTSFATAVVAGAYAERLCAGRDVEGANADLQKERYQGEEEQPFHLKRSQRHGNGTPPPR